MRLMKKNLKVLFLAVLVAAASCSFTTREFEDNDKDKLLIDLITYVLERGHYSPKDMDDEFSAGVYDDFLTTMDPLKRYFLESDMEEFAQYRLQIDDQLQQKDLTFFNLVYTRFAQRQSEAQGYYKEILDQPFDYSKQEQIDVDYENMTYAKSKKDLKERWRKQLKFTAIGNFYDLMEEEKEKVENEEGYTATPESELEEKARTTSRTSMDEYFDFTNDLERKDYFANFLNSVVMEFDPHTNYFAPPDRDRFDLRMSGKLEGIGARLQKRNDYIRIVEVISGGPAWRGEHIEVGDQIMKVKQEDEDEAVSVVGMRLDDAVKLIKGPKVPR
ncbi:PDZ domain-containing protein [Aureitalea marina]|uniref:PDZ domain-containing protein n=1 Tax=Aureitalea marina TaxID=930804 RepID=UPI0026A5373E